jgi:hypothetical protein
MFDPRVDSIISELKRLNQHFCKKVKCCLGISNTGDPNLVLNQQGDWISGGGGDIQTLLSDLSEYLGAKEASEDGRPLNYWYYNTFFNTVSKVTQYIDTFSSGTSTIDFTNNGGDDWDIGFKIAMDSEQLPIGQTVDDYDIDVYHYVSGIGTQIEQSTQTTDHTVNTSGNGAGVYSVEQAYNVYDNGNYVSSITMQSLYKVDGTGNLLAYSKCKGITVNWVSGLYINVTANVEQSESYPIEWYSFDGNNAPVLIGTGETLTLTLPLNCLFIIAQAVIDSVFTNDCPQSPYNLSSFIIN